MAVQQLALLGGQAVPAGQLGHRERALHLVPDGGRGPPGGPAVGQVLDQPQLLPRRQPGGQRVAGEVRGDLQVLAGAVGDEHVVVHAGGHPQPAGLGLVHEHRVPAAAGVQLGLQRLAQRGGRARVVGPGVLHHLVGQQVGLDGHVEVAAVVGAAHLVADRGDRPAGQRHQPGAAQLHGPPVRRAPLGAPPQHAGPQVQGALVGDDLAVVQVQRGVADQQPDQLAVGHVDDGLALLREAVAGLRVGQRPLLEEAVEVGARDDGGLALLQRAAHADVPVGQGEHRFVDREAVVVDAGLGEGPGLDREVRAPLGHDGSPSSSARSVTTTSAPCSRSASAWPTRSTPTT
ncbi:unannotated protein [freshwater metagenome]|uniref:Unannotated protein n=1 Tax=freshwater metagenome TaxID=449393 RepID=A0A6J7IMP4_9ZZZZ